MLSYFIALNQVNILTILRLKSKIPAGWGLVRAAGTGSLNGQLIFLN